VQNDAKLILYAAPAAPAARNGDESFREMTEDPIDPEVSKVNPVNEVPTRPLHSPPGSGGARRYGVGVPSGQYGESVRAWAR
jgi:hypothetical protein